MNMKILGIETSCDETAVAVVCDASDPARRILSNRVFSQREHDDFGGVVPEVAARAHLGRIDALVRGALDESGLALKELDAIAVTAGPGLIGGVLVGVMTAKAMAAAAGKRVVGVNHLEGHALSPRLSDDVPFPYLLLLVSGGHTQLIVAEGVGRYRRLGTTIDDAAGECFDKAAKLMGLGYPGGPALEKLAAEEKNPAAAVARFGLPRPMRGKPGCDFSFSGLKTAVSRAVANFPPGEIPRAEGAALAAAFQETVADVLAERTVRAADEYLKLAPSRPSLVVAGGVAANRKIRAALTKTAEEKGMDFVAPPGALCTDNAAMIAWAGLERLRAGIAGEGDFAVYPRWPLDLAAERKGRGA